MTIADGSVYNGMPASDLGEQGWECPWSGPNGGQCVETKQLADGRIALRQSTDPTGPALIYTSDEIAAFVQGIKKGLADHLTIQVHQTEPQAGEVRACPAATRPAHRAHH